MNSVPTSAAATAALEVCTFHVADLYVGIDIARVREINRKLAIAPAPHAPEAVCGVANLRGRVVTILDLRTLLGLPPVPPRAESRYIFVEARGEAIGLVVDRVADVELIEAAALLPPPANVVGVMGRFFRGCCERPQCLLLLLDLDEALHKAILSKDELFSSAGLSRHKLTGHG